MAYYNGKKVTVTQYIDEAEKGPSTDKVTITFEDGTTDVVAIGAVGELTTAEKTDVSKIEEPPPPEPPVT